MSNIEAAAERLSFDDILEAVQDSRRGRWFLKEFETRVAKTNSQTILDAIGRLETRMESMGSQAKSPAELDKVRAAVANARNDLIKIGFGKDAMSKEGRLFAELADMARKAMPGQSNANDGILRTIQLVDEIDRTIAAPTPDAGAKFFEADANLFERPAAHPKPVLVASADPVAAPAPQPVAAVPAQIAKPIKEEIQTGARLVIRKLSDSVTDVPKADVAAPSLVAIEAKPPEPVIVAAAPAPVIKPAETTVSDNPRIVIIRRKAEEMPEIDLAQETSAA
jgi:hypothetical protein